MIGFTFGFLMFVASAAIVLVGLDELVSTYRLDANALSLGACPHFPHAVPSGVVSCPSCGRAVEPVT
jgi:hypothetical protein